ncbi:unnamed protein product, partial [Symbiodinium sp. CCMP2456]
LSPAPAGMPIDVADEDCAVPLPPAKRRRKVVSIPVPAETSIHLTEEERELQQRHECLTTALQLYQPASAGAQPGLRLILPPCIMEGENHFTLCPLEVLATDCLHRRWVAFAQFEEILNGMPKTSDTRHPSPLEPIMQDQKTMFFGAYAQGPLDGLRTQTRRYPMVIRLLNTVIHTLCGPVSRSTLFLSRNRAIGLRTDPNNHRDVPNYLIPLSNFEGGQLFIESQNGDYSLDENGMRGYVHEVTLPFLRFNARRRHMVLPWYGRRLILGAFHVKETQTLSEPTRQLLMSLGFLLQARLTDKGHGVAGCVGTCPSAVCNGAVCFD